MPIANNANLLAPNRRLVAFWSRPALVKEVIPADVDALLADDEENNRNIVNIDGDDDIESDIMDMSNNLVGIEGREDENSGDSTMFSLTKAYTSPTPAFLRKNNIGSAMKVTIQPPSSNIDHRRQHPPSSKTGP